MSSRKAQKARLVQKIASGQSRGHDAERKRFFELRRRMEKRATLLVSNARIRARKRKMPFDLDQHIDDIQARIDRGVCEVTGFPFNLKDGLTFDSPSLDRIDSKQGYLIENIRVVLHCMNSAMGSWGEEKLWEVMLVWQKNRLTNQ